ncbi:hypothetical protein [Sphingopyxis sp. EG6]|uniref:hypothetical protein n=1 Tax=Sphingopyxis sp. EG6 TaxID=1874061 RepID=UPI000DC63FE0|nr:hypothetical protein [Sphingopyxis sp. EG6]BBB09750.1 replicase polyprotein [Sphingopyxis sp. EG6]
MATPLFGLLLRTSAIGKKYLARLRKAMQLIWLSNLSGESILLIKYPFAAVGLVLLATATASPALAAQDLPIAQGLYADDFEGCAKASSVFFYDGANFGRVNQGGPGYAANAQVNAIQRVGPPPGGREYAETSRHYRGFTLAWTAEDSGLYGSLAVRAGTPGKMTLRDVSFRNVSGGIDVTDTPYSKCEFGQLPKPMQAAIRSTRPQLAGGGAAPAAVVASAMPAPIPPFNIRPGHYVPVAAACASKTELIFYVDGKRAGWIDAQPFNPNRMIPIAGIKRRGATWVTDAATGETLRVLGAERIAVGDPEFGEETLRWCAAGEVRATARAR